MRKKNALCTSSGRLKVHGLLVHNKYPRLTKEYRNKLRAYKHLMKNNKIKESDMLFIKGHISYEKSVDALKIR